MHLFVYGSLKNGGGNHSYYLGDSKFIQHYKLEGHALVDLGHGFPYIIQDKKSFVYGEVYEVDKETIEKIDLLEGVPYLYRRVLTNYELNGTMEIAGLYYYLSLLEDMPDKKIKNGYWSVDNKKIFNVYVENRLYQDTADKIVFHMRFFDGDRTPTNRSYMELVKKRSHLELNIENEEIFILDCIHYGIITENSLNL
tara:strand:+ start:15980 stop:16570 length:591 start_codon:yes stop_codon:yes gene_type:complete